MLEFFGTAARKLSSFPFVAVLAIVAIALTQLEPLQDASPEEFLLYLIAAFGGLFLLVVFHFATKTPSVYVRIPAISLVFVISLCFAYIVVAITSRAFGGPWQPCIMLFDDECERDNAVSGIGLLDTPTPPNPVQPRRSDEELRIDPAPLQSEAPPPEDVAPSFPDPVLPSETEIPMQNSGSETAIEGRNVPPQGAAVLQVIKNPLCDFNPSYEEEVGERWYSGSGSDENEFRRVRRCDERSRMYEITEVRYRSGMLDWLAMEETKRLVP